MAQFNYATALRCIGQDLERRGIKCFDIRCEGKVFIVQGGYQEPPAPTPVTIYYRPADISEMEQVAGEKRSNSSPPKDFFNQTQVFRAIGGYLDKNQAQPIRITNNESNAKEASLRLEYYTRDQEQIVDHYSGSDLYGMCVTMYKQRGRLTGTGGRLARWRR
jgi:hypothetical protein